MKNKPEDKSIGAGEDPDEREPVVYVWIKKDKSGRYSAAKAKNQDDPLIGIGAATMVEMPRSRWEDLEKFNRQEGAWQVHLWSLVSLAGG